MNTNTRQELEAMTRSEIKAVCAALDVNEPTKPRMIDAILAKQNGSAPIDGTGFQTVSDGTGFQAEDPTTATNVNESTHQETPTTAPIAAQESQLPSLFKYKREEQAPTLTIAGPVNDGTEFQTEPQAEEASEPIAAPTPTPLPIVALQRQAPAQSINVTIHKPRTHKPAPSIAAPTTSAILALSDSDMTHVQPDEFDALIASVPTGEQIQAKASKGKKGINRAELFIVALEAGGVSLEQIKKAWFAVSGLTEQDDPKAGDTFANYKRMIAAGTWNRSGLKGVVVSIDETNDLLTITDQNPPGAFTAYAASVKARLERKNGAGYVSDLQDRIAQA